MDGSRFPYASGKPRCCGYGRRHKECLMVRVANVMLLIVTLSCVVGMLQPVSVAAEAEEKVESAESWTFEKVWYRGEKRPSLLKAYKCGGTLTVKQDRLEYRSKKLELDIPASDIRSVTQRSMKGDSYNDWAVVEYEDDGTTRLIGFKDGKKLGQGRDTVAIRDALQRLVAASSAEAGEDSSIESAPAVAQEFGSARMSRKEFKAELKRGFPPAPKALVTDPERMGVLLIEGHLKRVLNGYSMDGVGLVRADDEEHFYRAGPAPGRKMDGVVMFTGLEPGPYAIRIARGWNVHGWIAAELPAHPDLVVEVQVGEVQYVGRLNLKLKRKRTDFTIEHDPARESEVLDRFARYYEGTPWAALATRAQSAEVAAGASR